MILILVFRLSIDWSPLDYGNEIIFAVFSSKQTMLGSEIISGKSCGLAKRHSLTPAFAALHPLFVKLFLLYSYFYRKCLMLKLDGDLLR